MDDLLWHARCVEIECSLVNIDIEGIRCVSIFDDGIINECDEDCFEIIIKLSTDVTSK